MKKLSYLFLLLLPIWVLRPAAAQPRLDVVQLLTDVRILAADSLEGRGTGSAGSAKAQAYLRARFAEAGLQPFGEGYAHPFEFVYNDTLRGVNLLGYVPGSEAPTHYLVLTAHYDHLGRRQGQLFNGADDNASGVAGLLALAQHFAKHPPRHTLVFAALDAEEVGLQGANALLNDPPVPTAQMRLNVNLDMISRGRNDVLHAAGTGHYPDLKKPLKKVAAESPITLRFGHDGSGTGDDWTFSSDHGSFHRLGIPFIYFGVDDHVDYHRPTDDYENIDAAFFLRAVDTILEAVLALDAHLIATPHPASH